MPTPSELAKLRAGRATLATRVLDPTDAEYEGVLEHAIRRAFFDAITTRLRFTPPAEMERLVAGLADEAARRRKEG